LVPYIFIFMGQLTFKLLRGYQSIEEQIIYTLPSWTTTGGITTNSGYSTYTVYNPLISTTGSGTIMTTNLPNYTTTTTVGALSDYILRTNGTISASNFIGYMSSSLD